VALLLSLAYKIAGVLLLLTVCVALEQVATIERFTLRQRIPGAVFNALGAALGGLLAWILQQCWHTVGLSPFIVPLYDWLSRFPFGWAFYFLAIYLAVDFLTYWRHRAEHRFFWPIHVVHHSPRELHAANDIGHPLQVIPDLLLVWFPLSLIQLHGPGTPVAVTLLSALLSVYIHSPIDIHFGPLRRLIVDNRFHRIHHSTEPQHIDHNFGIGLSIWDWVFGTAHWPEKGEWPSVGVDGVPPPRSVTDFLLFPFRGSAIDDLPGIPANAAAGVQPH
jgi:sterol desaturase/sphingolipid hydroxylase (fatty acid hydroxylase superfamily)